MAASPLEEVMRSDTFILLAAQKNASDEEGRDHVRKYDDVAQRQHRIGSDFTWRKQWAWLCSGHGPKSVLLFLNFIRSKNLGHYRPNADRSVDREFDFLGSHVDVLSAVHLHPEERQSGASRST